MKDTNEISNELLNAYLDNELGGDERAEILTALETDVALAKRLCELRSTKELTQFAFHLPSSGRQQGKGWTFSRQSPVIAIAATLFLTVGILVGWFAHDSMGVDIFRTGEQQIYSAKSASHLPLETEQKKVILHVDTGEPERLIAALDSAEDLLLASAAAGSPLELEIIANAKGLNLLRADNENYAKRISELSERYDNFSILACSRAIKRLEDMGIKVKLVPEAGIASSALDQIINRLRQGWVYIKV